MSEKDFCHEFSVINGNFPFFPLLKLLHLRSCVYIYIYIFNNNSNNQNHIMYARLNLATCYIWCRKMPFKRSKITQNTCYLRGGGGVLHSKCPKFGKMSGKNSLLCPFTDFLVSFFCYIPHVPLFSRISSGIHTHILRLNNADSNLLLGKVYL